MGACDGKLLSVLLGELEASASFGRASVVGMLKAILQVML